MGKSHIQGSTLSKEGLGGWEALALGCSGIRKDLESLHFKDFPGGQVVKTQKKKYRYKIDNKYQKA